MKRLLYYDLCEWRQSKLRTPLILRGARQVGKTHVVRQLGTDFENFVEINFEKNESYGKIFELDLNPQRIVRDLSIATTKSITSGNTLLFLDEIQQCPRAITALRYFYEEMPELHIIAAGSLLDFALEKVSIPVGRVSYLFMYPMSFIEFLYAKGYEQLALAIVDHKPVHPFSEPIHNLGMRLLGEYFAIGGMPQAVSQWVADEDLMSCMQILQRINNVYQDDFAKYARTKQVKYVDLLFKQMPSLTCKRFTYSLLDTHHRKRELEPAMSLLEKAGILHRVLHSHGNGSPLGAEVDLGKYKFITLDIGLNQSAISEDLKSWFLEPSEAIINKGALVEAYVGQELLAYADPNKKAQLYYWQREKRGSNAEIDYLIELDSRIIPIEVKSGKGSSLQSMRIFLSERDKTEYGMRFSVHNSSIFDSIHSYPLFAIASISRDKKRLIRFLKLCEE